MHRLISIDPGHKKCGMLLVDLDKCIVLDGKVVEKNSVIELITSWQDSSQFHEIVLGNGTSSTYWENILRRFAPITFVEEKGSTLLARNRYWELWPPNYWLHWLPRGLMLPPDNLDAVAALVLLERHLNKKFSWPGPINFKTWHAQ